MGDDGLPRIHGAEWRPKKALKFTQELNSDSAKNEVLRFIMEQHDGHMQVVSAAWDHVASEGIGESFDGKKWHDFSKKLCETLEIGLAGRLESIGLGESSKEEVIPRREITDHLNRRSQRLLIDLRLCLRRMAYYMSVTNEMRLEWQRLMLRTRYICLLYTSDAADE